MNHTRRPIPVPVFTAALFLGHPAGTIVVLNDELEGEPLARSKRDGLQQMPMVGSAVANEAEYLLIRTPLLCGQSQSNCDAGCSSDDG